MATSRYSKVDEYGFERPEHFDYESYDDFMSNYMRILTRRSLRWNNIIKNSYRKNNTLKRFIRKGVPNDKRVQVWMSVSGADLMRSQSKYTYEQMKQKISNPSLIEIIQIDLPRTFPDNIFFTQHEYLPQQLFNVLATFAHQNSDVGYCQGLNYIVGLLLLVTKNEETSFWLLKVLVEKILPNYYVSNMAGLLIDLDVLDELIQTLEPQIHRHVHNVGMPWAMGTTKWFICLYAEVLPTETVLRIWDCLFNEGSKILFRVAITLVRLHKEQILEANELGDVITCFREMKNSPGVIHCHKFMEDVFKIPGRFTNDKLQKLRDKHRK